MDPVLNPYSPGAGTPPPELAGREDVRQRVGVALRRVRIGNPAKSVLMVGLRGVGKTVLLDQMCMDAAAIGARTLRIEAPEGRSLPAMLAPQLRQTLLKLKLSEKTKEYAVRSLRALAGFAKALKVKFNDIEINYDYEPEPGLADNGDLETDLAELLVLVGQTARHEGTVLAIFIDELQYVEEGQFSALITALHRCAQLKLPIMVIGAGLPQLLAIAGNAKSYAERLFDFPTIGPLNEDDARLAITKPALALDVAYTPEAVNRIITETQGYPYFLQEWCKQAWDVAPQNPIGEADVQAAREVTMAALDEGFFRVRFDRCTPAEKRYLRAMAELGEGPHRSGDIAARLGKQVNALAPVRHALIRKGMVWSPSYGDTAFTVPLFDRFMRRAMPMPNGDGETS